MLLTFWMITSSWAIAETPSTDHYLKPGASIRLVTPLEVQMQENAKKDVFVELITPSTGTMHLRISHKEGIEIEGSPDEMTIQLSTTTVTIPISINSRERGHYSVMFHAQITENGQKNTRVFGLPIYVGLISKTKNNDTHPQYIHMQGQETISK